MHEGLFILGALAALTPLLGWCFTHLPRERWQVLATVPVRKEQDGRWSGINFTYYGLIIATAQIIAMSMFFVLMGSVGISMGELFFITATLLAICLPASKVVARLVEKKPSTFTVGGATFIGTIIAPLVVPLVNVLFGRSMPVLPLLAALAVAYALGEGLGRLACLSFGCCYGKPLSKVDSRIGLMLEVFCTSFEGQTKKVSYEGGLERVKVIPVQVVTTVLYVSIGLVGAYLFFREKFSLAFVLPMVITQAWRFVSEMLRADYRGNRRITVYQVMSLVCAVTAVGLGFIIPSPSLPHPDVMSSLKNLWSPGWIIFAEGLWVAVFVYLGKSRVTAASITLYVRRNMI